MSKVVSRHYRLPLVSQARAPSTDGALRASDGSAGAAHVADTARSLSRRDFVRGVAILPGLACLGCAQEDGLDVLQEDFVITLSEHPDLQVTDKSVLLNAGLVRPISVTRLDPITFMVTGTECSHAHCGVERSGDGWKCPCHGSRFDLDGGLVKGPASVGLTLYDWILDGDTLTVLAGDA